jgi:hypothetical protein
MVSSSITIAEAKLQDLDQYARGEAGTLFAILDACDEPRVPEKAKELGEDRAVSLYRGWAEQDYWAIAPYLVQVDETMLKWIVENLWNDPWGVFATTSVGLDALRTHFRRFLKIRSPDGQELYFRFYDPRVLLSFVESSNENDVAGFFGPIEAFYAKQSDGKVICVNRGAAGSHPFR